MGACIASLFGFDSHQEEFGKDLEEHFFGEKRTGDVAPE